LRTVRTAAIAMLIDLRFMSFSLWRWRLDGGGRIPPGMNSCRRQSMAPMKMRSASRVMALVGTFAAAIASHAEETAPIVYDLRGGALAYAIVHKLHEVRARSCRST